MVRLLTPTTALARNNPVRYQGGIECRVGPGCFHFLEATSTITPLQGDLGRHESRAAVLHLYFRT
jgi:hypothetical protein